MKAVNTQQTSHRIDDLLYWIIIVTFGLIPIFFLPVTQDFYDTNKWMLLVAGSLLILANWAIQSLLTNSVTVAVNLPVIGLSALSLASLVSAFVSSQNLIEALISPFGAGTWVSLTILVSLGLPMIQKEKLEVLRRLLFGAASVLGIVAIYQFFVFGGRWTPVGSSLGLLGFWLLVIPILINELVRHWKERDETSLFFGFLILAVMSIGFILTVSQIVSNIFSNILPYSANWAILLEVFKNPKNALFGVGAENFLSAFTAGRPVALNATSLWNSRFTTGSSLAFHLATTLGISGLIGLGLLLISLWKTKYFIPIIVFLVLPPNLTVLTTAIALLLLSESQHHAIRTIRFTGETEFLGIGLSIGALAASVAILYFVGRSYTAEVVYKQSLSAFARGDGTLAYQRQISATNLNAAPSKYHTSLSQTSLALANAIASQSADRKLTTDLIGQAIAEGKLAVNSAPTSVLVWENLASLYQPFIGVAQNADIWTIASLTQAMQLDPTNPVLRLTAGSIYLRIKDYTKARDQYLAAINLKPDYANAHYNLAFVYKQQGMREQAELELKEAQKLVAPGSIDESRLISELNELRASQTGFPEVLLPTDASPPEP